MFQDRPRLSLRWHPGGNLDWRSQRDVSVEAGPHFSSFGIKPETSSAARPGRVTAAQTVSKDAGVSVTRS